MYQPTPDEQAWLDTLPPEHAQDWLRMVNADQVKADSLGITLEQYIRFCEEYDNAYDDGWDMEMTKDQYLAECSETYKKVEQNT